MNVAQGREECKSENWEQRTGFLAAVLEAAAVGDGHAEILVGIDGRVIDPDFIVEVRAGGASAEAHIANGVAAMDLLAGGYGEAGKVAVAGGDAVAVIDHDGLAVSTKEVGEGDHAIGGRDDGVTVRAANIHPAVKRTFPVKWVDALAEAAGDLAFNRPETGRGAGAGPIGRGGVASHAKADPNG